MEAMQNYFSFDFMTMCGIPNIKLEGNLEDWIRLKNKTSVLLEKYDFNEFDKSSIELILNNFIEAFNGHIDTKFWKQIFSLNQESGNCCDILTGWVGKFFPYAPHDSLHFSNKRGPE